jgi:spore coat polysaccharide biosynthesis protein SpsF
MKIGIVVQARMGSKRLPGKVLRQVNGRPLLDYLLARLSACQEISNAIIATSNDSTDDPVAAFCEERGIEVFRGELENVASRFLEVIQEYKLEAFVRVSGDSPLLDARLIDEAVKLFKNGSFDLVTNIEKRTYPHGQSVEVIRSSIFESAYSEFQGDDFEHVTPYFYRHFNKFKSHSMHLDAEDYSALTLSVDTLEDLERFKDTVIQSSEAVMRMGWKELLLDEDVKKI